MEVYKRHRVIIPKYLVGVDEAGRGALAGPVAVGLVSWEIKDWLKIKKFLKDYPAGKDSKKLTSRQRDFWFGKIKDLEKKGLAKSQIALIGNKIIDNKGINFAIKKGIDKCLAELTKGNPSGKIDEGLPFVSLVLLDGGLKAPVEWVNQRTVIKGDEKELIISLASIVAKVSRDRKMFKLARKYPEHDFHQHKGYGTKLHYQKISEFGVLIIHRLTYLPE